jgi:hypothetical protein
MSKLETKPITNLDQLMKKAKGLEDRAETITIDTGDVVLEMKNLTADEVLNFSEELTKMANDGNDSIVDEMKKLKEIIYLHCPILQEFAGTVKNEHRAEPWDVFDELFDAADKIAIRNEFYGKTGISKLFERVSEKNG